MRITDISIRSLQSPESGAKIYHCDTLTGFGVRVTSNGVKAFVLTYGTNRERLTLGRYPIIGLAEARNEAKRILAERTLGKHRPARLKVSEALERYFTEKAAQNRASSLRITRGNMERYFKHLYAKNLAEITTEDINRVTDRLLREGKPSASNHAFTAARGFFRWCTRRRYIPHCPLESLQRPALQRVRERVLSDAELKRIWRASDDCGVFGNIIKLCTLSGQRRTEIASLKREWIDLEKHTCTLPSEVTKNGKTHTFPLGQLSFALIQSVIVENDLRHDGKTSGVHILFAAKINTSKSFASWSKGKAKLDRLSGVSDWVIHDLRRTYATSLQRLGISSDVIEALLGHVGHLSGVRGVYQRHKWWDEMVEAVNKYDAWIRTVIE